MTNLATQIQTKDLEAAELILEALVIFLTCSSEAQAEEEDAIQMHRDKETISNTGFVYLLKKLFSEKKQRFQFLLKKLVEHVSVQVLNPVQNLKLVLIVTAAAN